MTRKKKKDPELPTATFSERLRLFTLPYFISLTGLSVFYALIDIKFHLWENGTQYSGSLIPFGISVLIVAFFFYGRLDILTYNNRRTIGLPVIIAVAGHLCTLSMVDRILRSSLDALSQNLLYFLLSYIGAQLLFLVFTNLPILYKEDLQRFKERKRKK